MNEDRLDKGVMNAAVKSSWVLLAASNVNDEYREVEEKLVVGIGDKQLKLIIRNDRLLLALAAVELDHKGHDIRYTVCVWGLS